MPSREENKKIVEEFLFPTREIKRQLEALAKEIEHPWWPPTDSYACCMVCKSWTPPRHPEAHDHEEWCSAHKEYLARRNIPARLRAIAKGEKEF